MYESIVQFSHCPKCFVSSQLPPPLAKFLNETLVRQCFFGISALSWAGVPPPPTRCHISQVGPSLASHALSHSIGVKTVTEWESYPVT